MDAQIRYYRPLIIFLTALLLTCASRLPALSSGSPASLDSGQSEKYQITLHYKLSNKKRSVVSGIEVLIPIPEDDAGQKITHFNWNLGKYSTREVKDQFGQKLLQVDIPSLAPHEKADLGYVCDVEVKPVRVVMDDRRCGTLSEIPAEIKAAYTGDVSGVYDISSPVIQKKAQELKEQYPNLVDRLKAIHDYVASRITYNLTGHWAAAPVVIERRTGSCSEYSFVFGALCRANGLPTRMVGSSHLRTSWDFPYKDSDYHRWIEVYLPPYGWIPFDATLDRGREPAQNCCGSYDFRTFRVSRGGVESNILGHSYVGCTKNSKGLEKDRYFVWVPLGGAFAQVANPLKK